MTHLLLKSGRFSYALVQHKISSDKTVNVSHSVNPKSEPFYRSYSKIFLLEMSIFNGNRINAHF